MLLDIYTDIQSSAWQHRRLLILISLHAGTPKQTCSYLAALHLCGHGWRTIGNPPTTTTNQLSQPSLQGDGHVCSQCASFSFLKKVRPFFSLSSFSFPLGILSLIGNSPDCLPVVVGKQWWWFGLKYRQMRCGEVNPDIFPVLYSVLPLLVSVHLYRGGTVKYNKVKSIILS